MKYMRYKKLYFRVPPKADRYRHLPQGTKRQKDKEKNFFKIRIVNLESQYYITEDRSGYKPFSFFSFRV